jgi:hypothetical protein
MRDLNLVMRFTLAGDGRPHVRHASRIKVGQGGLLLYDEQGIAVETIQPAALESFQLLWKTDVREESAISLSA